MCHGHEIEALREYLREAEDDRHVEADDGTETEDERVPAPADD